MPRKATPDDTHCQNVSISFQPEDYKRLIEYCQREERSMAWCIRKALRQWLDEQDKKR